MYLKIVYVTALSQNRHIILVQNAVQLDALPTRLLVAVFVGNALEKKDTTASTVKLLHSSCCINYYEAPLVRGLAADGTISVSRDGWTILNKYTGFITYIGVVSTVSPMIEKILLLRNY